MNLDLIVSSLCLALMLIGVPNWLYVVLGITYLIFTLRFWKDERR